MIKVGKILIDPNSIDTILCLNPKFNVPDRERGIHRIQIIYKSGVVKNTTSSSSSRRSRPALTPEARENQMIELAMDLAEQQLRDGTASSQLITEFVKRGSTKARLEKEILAEQKQLISAKAESLQSQKRIEELYSEALRAMRRYNGQGDPDEY